MNKETNAVGYFGKSLTPYYDCDGITIFCGQALYYDTMP